jgi:hypothetical protein
VHRLCEMLKHASFAFKSTEGSVSSQPTYPKHLGRKADINHAVIRPGSVENDPMRKVVKECWRGRRAFVAEPTGRGFGFALIGVTIDQYRI